jgi:hypothetical protein
VPDWAVVAFGLGLLVAIGYALVRVARGVSQFEAERDQPPAARPAPRPAVLAR